MVRYLVIIGIGILTGATLTRFLFWPEIQERVEVVETVRVDTVYKEVVETITIERERIKEVYVRDTIIKELKYPINRFTGLEPALFGDISYSGMVAPGTS